MTRLLIAGGCSVTDKNFYFDSHQYDMKVWPDIIGEELGIDVLNVGVSGAGNDYIANSVMDAIVDNQDKELTVMVLWSGANRLNFWDACHHVHVPNNNLGIDESCAIMIDKNNRTPIKHVYNYIEANEWNLETDLAVLNYNLRCMFRLTEFCEKRSINFYQMSWASIVANIMNGFAEEEILGKKRYAERYAKLIDAVPKNRYYSPKYFGTQSFRDNSKWVDDESMQIDFGHPNEKGHEWIAAGFMILKENQKIQPSVTESTKSSPVRFVYD